MDEIIVLDEPADETDDDCGWHRGAQGRGNRLCKAGLDKRKNGSEGNDRSANQDTQSREGGCVDYVRCAFPKSIVVDRVFHSVTEIGVASAEFVGLASLRGAAAPQVPRRNSTFEGANLVYSRSAGCLMVKTAQGQELRVTAMEYSWTFFLESPAAFGAGGLRAFRNLAWRRHSRCHHRGICWSRHLGRNHPFTEKSMK